MTVAGSPEGCGALGTACIKEPWKRAQLSAGGSNWPFSILIESKMPSGGWAFVALRGHMSPSREEAMPWASASSWSSFSGGCRWSVGVAHASCQYY